MVLYILTQEHCSEIYVHLKAVSNKPMDACEIVYGAMRYSYMLGLHTWKFSINFS
jgi:hypothetical protein